MSAAGAIIELEHGPYRLREQIAESAYGVVWEASAPGGGEVALKLINRASMERAHPALRERWIGSALKEIAFLRSLEPWDERHIVRLLDSGEHEGLPVLALELLAGDAGRHVAAARNRGVALEFTLVLDWMGQINQALAKVHQYGWRYLDLKPANLLIDAEHRSLKLADFGTNRLLDDDQPHTYAGTANWQAPEQFFPVAPHSYATDARTDYFALGAMFYFLVTGGLSLRFCRDCGQAFRDHQSDGAAMLRERHAGVIPPTLREDEAALFLHRIVQPLGGEHDATWCPGGSSEDRSAGHAALALLRSLLQRDAALRPAHAVQISRMLARIRERLNSRPAVAASGWKVAQLHGAVAQVSRSAA